jgi:TetR/AcrR family transcriptional regulator, tetracycline repressor protein
MKINRDMVTRAALTLLNQDGLEQLTLRRLAVELHVQAPTIYWHFHSKEELLDEMATTVLTEGAPNLVPARKSSDWRIWAATFGEGLRKTLLAYRDGARMVAGTRLTDTEYLRTIEKIGNQMMAAGFSVRAAVVLFSTIYNYTVSFVMEEQAVFLIPGKRSPRYSLQERDALLDPAVFPFLRRTTTILFDHYDRRFREGLELILQGAKPDLPPVRARERKKS